MKPLIGVVLSLVAFTAFADPSIVPALGTVSGGDTILITVDRPLHSCPICSPPVSFAEVTFGGVAARNVFALNQTIIVVTPPHAAGLVDVAITSEGEAYGHASFRYAGRGSPITRSNYEQILVPLALLGGRVISGAFGSQWATELWVSNQSNYAVELFNDVVCAVECPQFFAPDPQYPQIQSKSVTRIEPLDTGGSAFLYYVQKTYANDVSFTLHAADVSRSHENAGTEIGVVRERDFRPSSFDILNVPIDSLSRATLRVYDTDATTYAYADVTLYAMEGGAKLGTAPIELPLAVKKSASPFANVIPPFAGFNQIGDLRSLFHLGTARVRVNIQLHSTAHGWGFVSVTNNATQLITTYRPE
jgi:hypothetical protein